MINLSGIVNNNNYIEFCKVKARLFLVWEIIDDRNYQILIVAIKISKILVSRKSQVNQSFMNFLNSVCRSFLNNIVRQCWILNFRSFLNLEYCNLWIILALLNPRCSCFYIPCTLVSLTHICCKVTIPESRFFKF